MKPGERIGEYNILSMLGAGGMGEVWCAEDSKLGRQVALKVLPDDFADDPERHARFEREAKVLASLNHPNIATLHALEHLDGTHVLVMELVDGEGLDDVIARGPIPLAEVVKIALQIAKAVETAHEAGIVHRDLKPANVLIRPDGTVKVLDFGLAKTWNNDDADSSISLSPTLTRHATAAGVILGTAAYMAPEQARGKTVDRRADIWAFGVVVWEMLTGRKIFDGHTVTDIIAAVVTKEPDWESLPPELSPTVTRVLRRCLEKDQNRRFRDIGDVRIEIESADAWADDSSSQTSALRTRKTTTLAAALPWTAAAILIAIAIPLVLHWLQASPPGTIVQTAVLSPLEADFSAGGGLALSPNGEMLAFIARDSSGDKLWVRRLDSLAPQPLTGTEGASFPFWSPDNHHIAFFAGGMLKRISAVGGAVRVIAEARDPRGGCWVRDDEIVFAPDYREGLSLVPAGGGAVASISELDEQRIEKSHRWPIALPGGEHIVFLSQTSEGGTADDSSRLEVLSLVDRSRQQIINVNSSAAYAPPGFLLFWHDGSLVAAPFDAEQHVLTGEQKVVAPGVGYTINEMGVFSVSQTGLLAYHQGSGVDLPSRLEWYDRAGKRLHEAAPVGLYQRMRLSPDGRRVSYTEGLTVWVRDLVRGTSTRVTFDDEDHIAPVWSPDGAWLIFQTTRTSGSEIRRKPSSGLGNEELVFEFDKRFDPRDWSSDGNTLVFQVLQTGTEWDTWLFSFGDGESRPLVSTPFSDVDARFSPDGRFVVYASNESGQPEIYVVPASGASHKWQVSIKGGNAPVWSPAGGEIFFVDSDRNLTSVSVSGNVSGDDDLEFGTPQVLFRLPELRIEDTTYDVAPDGQRFLVNRTETQPTTESLVLVQNWEKLAQGGQGRD